MSDLTIAQLLPYTPLEIDDETVQTLNAKHVHAFLEVKTPYNRWFSRQVEKYDFQEGRDFVEDKNVRVINQQHTTGTGDPIEHHVTFDMAKELCLVANTPKGKEARRYFIAEEKKLRQLERVPQTPLVGVQLGLIRYAPVCWRCDTPITVFDMQAKTCQTYKVCLRCAEEAYDSATTQDRENDRWCDVLNSDRSQTYGRWKTSRDVLTLRKVSQQHRSELESYHAHSQF